MRILVLGANGYVGRLVAASVLMEAHHELVIASRDPETFEELKQDITKLACDTLEASGEPMPQIDGDATLGFTTVQFNDDLFDAPELEGVEMVINCIGSVEYFNEENLNAVNITLTDWILAQCKVKGIEKHIYISTAFAPAVSNGKIEERIYGDEGDDPTFYTQTKRKAEQLVATSGLDYLIVRPSVVIGDSRTGHYAGKRYGIYQLWDGAKRLLPGHIDVMRLACPQARMNFVHQDAVIAVMRFTLRKPWRSRIINLASDSLHAPTMEALWALLFDDIGHPDSLEWAPTNDALDYRGLSPRVRAFNAFCRTNLEIASRNWMFDRPSITVMKAEGLDFAEALLPTIRICQSHFMALYNEKKGRVFNE
ncbi:short-chain dehydrogenase [Grimontia sp. AD028]|uniref:NAD-dependent epimerase/dehydratase family protein n=1 Tax=Grimontia sp. AD028 TaxID=1581149 RepID=UPI00061AD249|nr:NAD-dependent epimerase/dehydratase family protein [Grimontia sp. AD028]KKD60530.1 short-chain dehydrogenase [Grimontia sp. AD028]